jgi:branched-chain amino acid transport system ATP-binding protein
MRGLRRFDASGVTGGAPVYPLAVLFGLNAVDELDQAAFHVLLPTIRDHFGLDNEGVLTIVALVAPIAILVGLPVAFYADRAKRTRVAAGGGAVWGAFSFLTGLAPNVAGLVTARSGSALGKAVNLPVHNSLLTDYYPIETRAKVFGAHRAANSTGLMLGPLLAGGLSFVFGWRAPFLVFAAITACFVLLALRLREPVRGRYEREAAGAGGDAVVEEAPPRFGESWRLLHSIVTLRRMYFALPFLAVTVAGFQSIISLFYEEVYGVGDAGRGALIALDEPIAILALVLGAPVAQRMIVSDPGRAMRYIGLIAVANGLPLLLIAVSPNLPIAVAGAWMVSALRALMYPALFGLFSLVIPPKARSLGFQGFAVWSLPGLVVLPVIGGIGDAVGFRWALLTLGPLYVIGALVLSTAAPSVAKDIENAREWSLLEARARAERIRIAAAVEAGEVAESSLPMLEVRGVDFSYGPLQVLFDVDLEVQRGARVALLGTNGAGKSTLLKVVAGLVQPDAGSGGSVWFDGEDVTWLLPEDRVKRGMIQIGGGRATFPGLTVEENLRIGAYPWLEDRRLVEERLEEVLDLFPVLRSRARQRAGTLSGGEQQMMALGRASIAGPRLLMIDELSLGLAPVVMGEILRMIEEFVRKGTTLLVVEQSLNVAAAITDHGFFMEKGEIRFSGPTIELLDRGDLARSVFFGSEAAVP